MYPDQEFHDFIAHDLLADVPGITSKRMFGCWGIFKDGKMFGIIDEGELFLKTNKEAKEVFKKAGSSPLEYKSRGKTIALSYWKIPPDALEEKDVFLEWIERSWQDSR